MDIDDEMMAILNAAVDAGGVPIVMAAYTGPPPAGEFYLRLMREMLIETGRVSGCIAFGTTDGHSGMFPLVEVDPQTGLSLLIEMRRADIISKINWVTVAGDAYRRVFEDGEVDPDSIRHGDVELMKLAGDEQVEEALTAVCIAPDGPGFDLFQPYVRTEAGVEWSEVEYLPDEIKRSGEIPRLMNALVAA